MKLKYPVFILLMIAVFSFGVLAAVFGRLEVQVPNVKYKIYIDNIYRGRGDTTVRLRAGYHKVKVLENGSLVYKKSIYVTANKYRAIKAVSISANKPAAARPMVAAEAETSRPTTTQAPYAAETSAPRPESRPVAEARPAAEERPTTVNGVLIPPQDKKPRWGLTANASALGAYGFYSGLGMMLGVGGFYSDVLMPGWRYEVAASYCSGFGNDIVKGLSFIPIEFSVKNRFNDNITIGGGLRMTFASFSYAGYSVSDMGIGYQINCEIDSISSEIGMSNYDIYYKYKLYL